MPRPSSEVWDYFEKSEDSSRRAICKFCGHDMASLVARMKVHLICRCAACPDEIKDKIQQAEQEKAMELISKQPNMLNNYHHLTDTSKLAQIISNHANNNMSYLPSDSNSNTSIDHINNHSIKRHKITNSTNNNHSNHINHHSDDTTNGTNGTIRSTNRRLPYQMNLNDKIALDRLFTCSVFGSSLPLEIINNPLFKYFLRKINPNYEIPSIQSLTVKLLENEQESVNYKIKRIVAEATTITLTIDSCAITDNFIHNSIPKKRSLLIFIIHAPNPCVYEVIDTQDSIHTPLFIADHIEVVLHKIGLAKLGAIVMNINNIIMEEARKILESKYSQMVFVPSCYHLINDMICDIINIDSCQKLLYQVKEILNTINENHLLKSCFIRLIEKNNLNNNSSSNLSVLFDVNTNNNNTTNEDDKIYKINSIRYLKFDLNRPLTIYNSLRLISDNKQIFIEISNLCQQSLNMMDQNKISSLFIVRETDNNEIKKLANYIDYITNDTNFWYILNIFCDIFHSFRDILLLFENDYTMLSIFYHNFNILWEKLQLLQKNNYNNNSNNNNNSNIMKTDQSLNDDSIESIRSFARNNTILSQTYRNNTNNIYNEIINIVGKHWNKMEHSAMYASYLLDPRFPPELLSSEKTMRVVDYLKGITNPEIYTKLVSEITKYTSRSDIFSDVGVWDSATMGNPINWWKGFIGSTCPYLQDAAIRILSFPASSTLPLSKWDAYDKFVAENYIYTNSFVLTSEQVLKGIFLLWNNNLLVDEVQITNNINNIQNTGAGTSICI